MKETELKPCPFCGGEAVLEAFNTRKGYEATIQCNGRCILYMSTITYDTEEEAVDTEGCIVPLLFQQLSALPEAQELRRDEQ